MRMAVVTSENYNDILRQSADNLDISPTKYKEAVDHYTAVGNWLDDGDFGVSVSLYPQGSFKLGTVVRPLKDGKECDYDIDLVCELQADKSSTTPKTIKQRVGSRLQEHVTYREKLEDEGKRCWTLNYAESDGIGFHMDVLPATPEDRLAISQILASGVTPDKAAQAIAITDRNGNGSYAWSTSNPKGFADWFQERQKAIFDQLVYEQKQILFSENQRVFASVEDVPDQLVKTPLQRAIQLLKRHRDRRFLGHGLEDSKPISMIITMLAASLYQGEPDVLTALSNVVKALDRHAQLLNPGFTFSEQAQEGFSLITRKDDGKWHIPNPLNRKENFADRWHEDGNKRARAFFQWVAWARQDLVDARRDVEFSEMAPLLERALGAQPVKTAGEKLGLVGLGAPAIIVSSRKPETVKIENPSKPWRRLD
jgi:hypothetical protein